jgi:hypothetical protein
VGKKLTLKGLEEFRRQLNSKEANAVTDQDADRTDIATSLLRDLIATAELGLRGEELASVGRTVMHLNTIGIIHLDPDTKRELEAALEPFKKPVAGVEAVEEAVTL